VKPYQVRGLFFEQLVRRLVTLSGYKKVSSGFVPGRGEKHQIDAFGRYEFVIPFTYPIRLICEAKWLKRGIHLNHVRDFEGVIKDISENYFSTRGIRGKDFTWKFLNRYTDCGVFFSATNFTDPAQHYAYAQGIYLVPFEGNSIVEDLLKELERIAGQNNQAFKTKMFFNMAEDKTKATYSKKAQQIIRNSKTFRKMLSKIGTYLGILDGIYPVHILTRLRLPFRITTRDDYNIQLTKTELDIRERSLHFKFRDMDQNILEFTLPRTVGYSLIDTLRRFYKKKAFSYIDIPVIVKTEEGSVRRIFKGVINPDSRQIITRRLKESS